MQPLQARDLRIGNLVHEEVLGVCEVSQITENTIWVKVLNQKEDGTSNKREFHLWIEHLRPIPLSEQWLLDFGFEVNHCDDGTVYYTLELSSEKYCDLSLISCDKNGYLEVGLFPYESIFRFRYLHQLQNICLDLGQELTTNTK